MDINNHFSTYKITNIYSECMKKNLNQYPCYHQVDIKMNHTDRIINNCLVSSETIAEYYKFYNVSIPLHFSNYGSLN
jgi:hypothetical protein